MKKLLSLLLFIILPINTAIAAETPNVVVSIKPIHSLVSAVMEGVATPDLIIKKGSPHGYTLRPSEAKVLENADLVVWVGHDLESFLEKPLNTLAKQSQKLTLSETLQSSLLTKREGGEWAKHSHGDHKEASHDDHAAHESHDHEEADHDDHAAHESHDHEEASMDFHIWLSPTMAKKITIETTKALVKLDPAHAAQYQSNSEKLLTKLVALDSTLKTKLAPVKDKPYIVFHAAYQYFENDYDLNAVGSVTIDPERKSGAKGISEIRNKVARLGVACVFSEPQFESSLVQTIIEGTDAKTGTLDPLGSSIPAGPDAYFVLMNNLANDLVLGLQ
ncbi:zinc ABC transporter substrate-binding protein ZnuA [Psychromonas sp. PT13]|uniref:zinc ABC transporter substrate-binding protein ZnuA n=1 Tax=Psychromonas sp. PT13 TaxID=3439547 RepID=UPI003EB9C065